MPILGYKPAGAAQGVGQMAPGTTRATRIGSFASATWITRVWFYAGRAESTNGKARPAIYAYSGGQMTTRLWQGSDQTLTTYMAPNDRTTGQLYSQAVTDFLLLGSQEVGGAIANTGSTSICYGQDHSGEPMHYSNTTAPNPFSYRTTNPILAQGKMHVALEGVTNRRPNQPGILTPADGSTVTSEGPSLVMIGSDPDAEYGDYLTAYRVEVFNEDKTSRLHDSGWQSFSAGGPPAGLFGYTLPNQTPGRIIRVRVTTRDRAGAVSPATEVTYLVVSAGSWEDLSVGDIGGTRPDGVDVVNSTTPSLTATWKHSQSKKADETEVRIVKADGSVYRGPWQITTDYDVDDTLSFDFTTPNPDWPAMAEGTTVYYYEVRSTDEDGNTGAWSRSRAFMVNATPTTVSKLPMPTTAHSSVPRFACTISDGNDPQSSMRNMAVEVQPDDESGTLTIPLTFIDRDPPYADIWEESQDVVTQIAKTTFFATHGHGTYKWKVVGEDPWGKPISDTLSTFSYQAPPSITITSPTGTIQTGTPNVSFTADTTVAWYKITLFRAGSGGAETEVWNSGVQGAASSSVTHQLPAGVLRNKTTYRVVVWITATNTLTNEEDETFTLEYEAPWYMPGVQARLVRSSDFDIPQPEHPGQRPNVEITWDRVDEEDVSDDDWIGYVIYRISEDGFNREWVYTDRNRTMMVDTTPAGGIVHRYYVGYRQRINGIDTLESRLVMHALTPEVNYATLTSENEDDPSVSMPYWRNRRVTPVTDTRMVEVFGEEAPLAFQGTTDYDVIDAEFQVLSDRSGQALFDARDIVEAARTLKALQPLSLAQRVRNIIATILGGDAIGPRPRVLWYRDPKRRALPVVITHGPDETDMHMIDRAQFRMQLTEVAREVRDVAISEGDDVEDMTGVIEPTMLLPLGGSLEGRDRSGMFTATGSGALRWVPGQGGYPGRVNYARNPTADESDNLFSNIGSGVTRTWEPNGGRDGKGCVRWDCDGTIGLQGGTTSTASNTSRPGELWSVGAWVKGPEGKNGRLLIREGGAGSYSNTSFQFTGDWQWVTMSRVLTDPDQSHVQLRIDNSGFANTAYSFWVDDVIITPGEIADEHDGRVNGELGPGYGWLGTPHASPSYREAWVYGGAALIEESTTNYIANPLVGTGTNNITLVGVDEEDVLRDSPADKQGRYGLTVLCDGEQTHQGVTYYTPNGIGIEEGEPITIAADFGLTGDEQGRFWAIVHFTDSTTLTTTVVRVDPNVGVKRIVIPTYTVPAGKTVDRVAVSFRTNASTAGVLRIGGVQVEKKAYPTSQVPQVDREGNLLPGYSWTGTEHASASERQAAWVDVPVRGMSTERGELIVRARFDYTDEDEISQYVVTTPGVGPLYLRRTASRLRAGFYGTDNIIGPQLEENREWFIASLAWEGNQAWLYVDDPSTPTGSVVVSAPSPVPIETVRLGRSHVSLSQFLGGRIDGVLAFPSRLSPTERQRAFEQLEWRWNSIQADEPQED